MSTCEVHYLPLFQRVKMHASCDNTNKTVLHYIDIVKFHFHLAVPTQCNDAKQNSHKAWSTEGSFSTSISGSLVVYMHHYPSKQDSFSIEVTRPRTAFVVWTRNDHDFFPDEQDKSGRQLRRRKPWTSDFETAWNNGVGRCEALPLSSASRETLQQGGVASVTDSHGFGGRGERHRIVAAGVAEDLTAVAAVMLGEKLTQVSIHNHKQHNLERLSWDLTISRKMRTANVRFYFPSSCW